MSTEGATPDAALFALAASGGFLLAGMVLGVWKYRWMLDDPSHRAPVYVDVAHRAALMYSFACLVLRELAALSPYSPGTTLTATAVPIALFATAVLTYVWHGLRGRTDNQFAERNLLTTWGMVVLIVGEVSGVAVLLWGFVSTRLL